MSSYFEPVGYEYHSGTGKHILVEPDPDVNRPQYSVMCCLCKCLDYSIFLFAIAFLGGAFYLCFYLYNNYD